MSENTQIVEEKKSKEVLSLEIQERQLSLEKERFALDQRVGQALCQSMFFPKDLRGDLGAAMIVSDLSKRMDVSPMEIAQNIYLVYGNPSFSSKYMAARLNSSGCILGSLDIIFSEDRKSCHAEAVDAVTGKTKKGMIVTMKMAEKEGWSTKKGSKWVTMPELMLGYRAQSFFINTYYPQVTYGMRTLEELEDIGDSNILGGAVSVENEIKENANKTIFPTAEAQPIEAEATEVTEPEPQLRPDEELPLTEEDKARIVANEAAEAEQEQSMFANEELGL